MGFIKKNNSLVKVIELEDQSMRSIGTKLTDIANLETVPNGICSDDNPCSNIEKCSQESFAKGRFNVIKTPIGR